MMSSLSSCWVDWMPVMDGDVTAAICVSSVLLTCPASSPPSIPPTPFPAPAPCSHLHHPNHHPYLLHPFLHHLLNSPCSHLRHPNHHYPRFHRGMDCVIIVSFPRPVFDLILELLGKIVHCARQPPMSLRPLSVVSGLWSVIKVNANPYK